MCGKGCKFFPAFVNIISESFVILGHPYSEICVVMRVCGGFRVPDVLLNQNLFSNPLALIGFLEQIPGQASNGDNIEGLGIFKNAKNPDQRVSVWYLLDDKDLIGLLAMVDVDWMFAVGKELLVSALLERVECEVVDCLLSGIHLFIT
jgi:hypothetical protein